MTRSPAILFPVGLLAIVAAAPAVYDIGRAAFQFLFDSYLVIYLETAALRIGCF